MKYSGLDEEVELEWDKDVLEANGLCFEKLELSLDMLMVGFPRFRFARMIESKRRMFAKVSGEGEDISRSEMNSLNACVPLSKATYSAMS